MYKRQIQIESDGDGDHSGVSTLTIELPVEAREKLLEITRKCIFEQGMEMCIRDRPCEGL